MSYLFVSGLQLHGACTLYSGHYFAKDSHARAVAEDSTTGTKCFTLEEYVAVRVTWKEGKKVRFNVLQIPAFYAQTEESTNEWVERYWGSSIATWEPIP